MGEIVGAEGGAGEWRGGEEEFAEGIAVESAGGLDAVLHLEGAEGGLGLGTRDTVDGTGIDAVSGEGELGFEDVGGGPRRPGWSGLSGGS